MTNGEKFKTVFGFGADGSRVIAVNSTWWDCDFLIRKPKTNADRIRSMTDEELAEFLSGSCPKIHPENHFKDCMVDNTDEWNLTENECRNCWLTWLKREAE